eukprot:TRINITY_DN30763_c0_g1_i5.p2 TRINITY_DN30763_c0_g1~~TRINITY_DN30763_c0_g1_i5.p2  ORF type:complete len:138 (+),score=3.77 TRINITY_DN30763_c0_g1_i5:853-1266(+)
MIDCCCKGQLVLQVLYLANWFLCGFEWPVIADYIFSHQNFRYEMLITNVYNYANNANIIKALLFRGIQGNCNFVQKSTTALSNSTYALKSYLSKLFSFYHFIKKEYKALQQLYLFQDFLNHLTFYKTKIAIFKQLTF